MPRGRPPIDRPVNLSVEDWRAHAEPLAAADAELAAAREVNDLLWKDAAKLGIDQKVMRQTLALRRQLSSNNPKVQRKARARLLQRQVAEHALGILELANGVPLAGATSAEKRLEDLEAERSRRAFGEPARGANAHA